jgi:hypothetical protein
MLIERADSCVPASDRVDTMWVLPGYWTGVRILSWNPRILRSFRNCPVLRNAAALFLRQT